MGQCRRGDGWGPKSRDFARWRDRFLPTASHYVETLNTRHCRPTCLWSLARPRPIMRSRAEKMHMRCTHGVRRFRAMPMMTNAPPMAITAPSRPSRSVSDLQRARATRARRRPHTPAGKGANGPREHDGKADQASHADERYQRRCSTPEPCPKRETTGDFKECCRGHDVGVPSTDSLSAPSGRQDST